jgi:hypothetical protein
MLIFLAFRFARFQPPRTFHLWISISGSTLQAYDAHSVNLDQEEDSNWLGRDASEETIRAICTMINSKFDGDHGP